MLTEAAAFGWAFTPEGANEAAAIAAAATPICRLFIMVKDMVRAPRSVFPVRQFMPMEQERNTLLSLLDASARQR
jgi:hypothetical protein